MPETPTAAARTGKYQTAGDEAEQAYRDGLDEMADRLLARADQLDSAAKET